MQHKYIIELTEKMIGIKSIASNPHGLQEILEFVLSEMEGFTIERFERNGVQSALVYNTPVRPDKFRLLFNTHLDVIPGKDEQYVPKIVNNKLYGVGSMDMKANIACVITAFKEVAHSVSFPVAIQFVTDEEVGGFDGTKYQIEQGIRADFVLASEPTNFDIVHQAKGVLWLRIKTHGTTAHGAYPWRGENAVWSMYDFLSVLKTVFPVPSQEVWKTTVNLSQIQTENTVFNKIPDECTVGLDIRFVHEDADRIVETIKRLLPKGASIEMLANEPSLCTEEANSFLQTLKEISAAELQKEIVLRGANGTSDARHFSGVGCDGIEFGPIGGGIGSDEEWVDIYSLQSYYNIIKQFILRA